MTIKQYNGQQANFYIQCKGEHSGKPLKKPIPNCFAVFTDIENAYEIAYAAYVSKVYTQYIKGSVIPFIRVSDAKEVLSHFNAKINNYKRSNLDKIKQIDIAILKVKKQLELLEQSKIVVARSLIK